MGEESYGFDKTRVRLEEIVSQVRKKDVSLEKSLDLLEEGVRLANQCVELIDHADWEAGARHGEGSEPREDLSDDSESVAARADEPDAQSDADVQASDEPGTEDTDAD